MAYSPGPSSATAANSSDPAGPPYVTELHSPSGIVPGEIVQVIPSGLVITLSWLTATKSSYPTGPPQVTDCQLPKGMLLCDTQVIPSVLVTTDEEGSFPTATNNLPPTGPPHVMSFNLTEPVFTSTQLHTSASGLVMTRLSFPLYATAANKLSSGLQATDDQSLSFAPGCAVHESPSELVRGQTSEEGETREIQHEIHEAPEGPAESHRDGSLPSWFEAT